MSLEHLPGQSRVWVFIANRLLDAGEIKALTENLKDFTLAWKTHGAALSAGFEISNPAVVIAVNEQVNAPSGCSIDKAFRLLQDFGSSNAIDFFNRFLVVKINGDTREIITRSVAADSMRTGMFDAGQLVFNPLVQTVQEFRDRFVIPFREHWLGKQILEAAG